MKVAKESYPDELSWSEHGWNYRIVNRSYLFDWFHSHPQIDHGKEALLCTLPGGAFVVIRDHLAALGLIESEEVKEES